MRTIRCLGVACSVMAAIGLYGCSGSTAPPATPTATAGSDNAGPTASAVPAAPTQPRQNGNPQAGPAVASQPTQPPAQTPAAPKVDPAQDLLAKIQDLQGQRQRIRTRQEFATNQRSILDLSNKVLELNPEPAIRDQARQAWLEAVAGVTMVEAKAAANLLQPLDKLADAIIAESPDSPNAANAHFCKIMGHLNVERDGSENDPSVNKRLLDWTKEFAGKFPKEQKGAIAAFQIGQNAESDGQTDTAKDAYRFVLDLGPDPQLVQQVRGQLTKLELIGKPMAIVGPTIAGSEINIEEFKGKVVLVDFWATWCGPCIAELPNVQKVYEKYHDAGFEIIAISFDNGKEPLEKFVADRKIPWAQIFFDEEGKRGWTNPIGQMYGINAIPATFLVDREGNVAKIGVRGTALEPTVAELLKGSAATPKAN